MFRKLEDDLMRNGFEPFWSLFIHLFLCDPLLPIFDVY